MPVLEEPLVPRTARVLRRAVLDLARSEHRKHVPPVLHLGLPGGAVLLVPHDRAWDHGLRTDVVASILAVFEDPQPLCWLTRGGPDEANDVDADWLAPVLAAHAESGRDATFVVVTRHGWTDPRTGVGRRWKRIRGR